MYYKNSTQKKLITFKSTVYYKYNFTKSLPVRFQAGTLNRL